MKAIVVSGHHSGGRFTVLGIPGVYENGVPVPVESTGRTEEELRELFERTPFSVKFVGDEPAAEPDEKPKQRPATKAEKEG